ncbi:transcriptional regulator, GntR family [Ethanoligenens harbinense YUAN-3]|uniref:Transcriptional regulator, GntR family n=2 Tax=Ethanoligenens harbinense TaxID=253239 RepID=E6U4C7_ETHHY|nr:GntR family transcriptional regulator [Ethanoligenens harbinense]ADU27734.1 transcriptional regulator, GntR family [Ethanoligenens harbinense YUAN-3]
MQKIQDGIYPAGGRLPSESELAKTLHVGRSTIREALKILQRDNVLTSFNGVGTYINEKYGLINNSLNRLKSLGQMIKDAGYQESECDIRRYSMAPENEWANKLQIDEDVFVMERTRTADSQKIAFYYNIFPASLVGDAIGDDFSGGILNFLEKELGIRVTYAISEICVIDQTNERDRKAVGILGPDVILLKQLHLNKKNVPVFYSLDYLKSDAFHLVVKREI